MKERKLKILALSDFYLPGYKAGGALRALAHLTAHLRADIDFVVLARGIDAGNSAPYTENAKAATCKQEGYEIRYVFGFLPTLKLIVHALREPWDAVYLNSSLSPVFSLFPLLLRYLGITQTTPFIVAPRGEFMDGALKSKKVKKLCFLQIARWLNLYRDVTFHTTSDDETNGLGSYKIYQARDLPPTDAADNIVHRAKKQIGILNLVFISRIDPKKNLDFSLNLLKRVTGLVNFDIFGPVGEPTYWNHCQKIIEVLPTNIKVRYHGPLPHEKIHTTFAQYDLFIFPTRGENNGYVISEAFSAGCPVLVSDLTPWRKLKKLNIGYDYPLNDVQSFIDVINQWVLMDETEHHRWRLAALQFSQKLLNANEDIEQTRELFYSATKNEQ